MHHLGGPLPAWVRLAVVAGLVAAGLVAPAAGCNSDRGEVREWQAGDHDHGKGGLQVKGTASGDGNLQLVRNTWRNRCAPCHGATGRGDGPQGRMLKAPDLTRASWQARVNDEALANVIRKGRNKMPENRDLPADVIDGLVALVRSFKR